MQAWIPFYTELANKLRTYKNKRSELLRISRKVYDSQGLVSIKYPFSGMTDIDPFSVFAWFNKGITNENRIAILNGFSAEFNISLEVPKDFAGIPTVDNRQALFFAASDPSKLKPDDLDNLWFMFEAVLDHADGLCDEAAFIQHFDTIRTQECISSKITSAFFWMRPASYLSMDGRNRQYLKGENLLTLPDKLPDGKSYLNLIRDCKKLISKIGVADFVELSINAWEYGKNKVDSLSVATIEEETPVNTKADIALNSILYGPPGTGKTYNTVVYALAICDSTRTLQDLEKEAETREGYEKLLREYETYVQQGRIVFTTFHQSYGYEDFIEGIKPKFIQDSGLSYGVEAGVFKKFCQEKIKRVVSLDEAWNQLMADVRKGNGEITINRSQTTRKMRWNEKTEKFYDISKPSLEWQYADKQSVAQCHSGELEKVDGNGSQAQKYYNSIALYHKLIDEYHLGEEIEDGGNKVFIIDEINRGNVSKIFGELITLIEDDKRGKARVTLPYSGESFTVPENIYILGTMNTADRSITALDTALRRRFSFVEKMPNPDVKALRGLEIDGVNISKMLTKINQRIEVLFDREHTIGHAYFTKLQNGDGIGKLAEIFRNKVIPLLQEYFYEDYAKIRLVLADNQVPRETEKQFVLENAKIEGLFGIDEPDMLDETVSYSINDDCAFMNPEAYKKIYE